ncbi:MAG: HAD family hydrolase [Bacteroidales bacterium]|nr:HAD family hydrolase [Bacteroidales bacterium]
MSDKLLIFDFDGTLADTTEGIVLCTQETLRIMGVEIASAERIRSVIGLPLRECFEKGSDTPEDRLDEAVETYRRIFNGIAVPRTVLYEGVPDTLAALRGRGYRLSIATSRSGKTLRMLLSVLGISEHFCELAATEEVEHPKPAPDLALLLMERLGADPARTVVIGDTVFDLKMGRGAGCRTVGVTFGNQDREQLATASPDWIVDRFPDLLDILP